MLNGYGKSLFDTEDGTCINCGYVGDTARHEIIHGPHRKLAKKFGLWIAVCPRCHSLIHADENGEYLHYKEEAQARFMNEYNVTTNDFIKLFGANYL